MTPEDREALAQEIDAKIRPLLGVGGVDGYDCCGCASPEIVLRDALALLRGESPKLAAPLDL